MGSRTVEFWNGLPPTESFSLIIVGLVALAMAAGVFWSLKEEPEGVRRRRSRSETDREPAGATVQPI